MASLLPIFQLPSSFFALHFCLLLLLATIFQKQWPKANAAGVFKMPMRKHHKMGVNNNGNGNRREMLLNADDKSKGLFTQKLHDYQDRMWLVTVTIGTPGQEFNVELDTGSTDLWIPGKDCLAWKPTQAGECNHNCFTSNKPYGELKEGEGEGCSDDYCGVPYENDEFDSEKSSTFYKNKTSSPFFCLYGTGWAHGSWANDTVKFGPKDEQNVLVVPGASIGLAKRLDEHNFGHGPINGMLGLDYVEEDKGMIAPLGQAVRDGLLDKHMFTIYLHTNASSYGDDVGGVVTYGGLDTENCQNVSGWAKIERKSKPWWNFEIEGISLGSANSNYSSSSQKQQLNAGPMFGISDTGCSMNVAKKAVLEPILESIRSAGVALESNQRGGYNIPCDADYPPLVFRIGGQNYTLEKEFMTVHRPDSTCSFGIMQTTKVIEGSGDPDLILGDPFIRKYCQVYDFEHSRVGFAEKKPQAK